MPIPPGLRLFKVGGWNKYHGYQENANYHEIVQEYKDEDEMIDHLVSYEFDSVLPVIHTGGVKIIDEELYEYEAEEV